MRRSATCLLLPSLLAMSLALGVPRAGRGECRPRSATDVVRLPRSPASLPELAAWIAGLTCKNVVYSSVVATRAGTAAIVAPNDLTAAQAHDLFVDAMSALGLVVQRSKLSIVVKAPRGEACVPAEPASAALDLARHVRRKTDTEYEVTRALLDAVLADPTTLRRAATSEFRSEGPAAGLRLISVKPGLLWAHLGLRSGDVIARANAIAMTRAEQALMAFVSLRGKREVTLEVRRGGKSLTMRYRVLDPSKAPGP